MPSVTVSETSNGAPVHTNGKATSAEHEKSTIANNDISTFRRFVPLVSEGTVTYLNASFAPPSNIIIHEAITRYASEALYSPMPKPTWQATMKDVRQLLARYINTDPSNIALTRDTTEALGSIIRGLHFKPGDNVVILDSEHPNHAYQWMSLRSAGLQVRQVSTIEADKKAGKVKAANAETFSPYVDDRTIAIGLSSIMFHSGQWNDVADICSTFRSKGIHVIADITQQVGFATVDVQALGVSAAAFSLHKGLHCPTGLAALYVDPDGIRDVDPTPPIVGYGAVSNVRADLLVPEDPIVYHPSAQRYDHLNLSLISGTVAKAYLSFYLDVLKPKTVENHLYALGDVLKLECVSLGINIVGPDSPKEHAPHLYILDLHDERWMPHLRDNGIIVTPYRLGIRVSFGFYDNTADVKNLATVLRTGIEAGIHVPKTSC